MKCKMGIRENLVFLVSLLMVFPVLAEMPRVYPGAISDNELNAAWKSAMGYDSAQPKANSQGWFSEKNEKTFPREKKQDVRFYLTNDSFDKVVEFYRNLANEDTSLIPQKYERDEDSKSNEDREAYFLFDDAKSVEHSRSYVRIQYPANEENDKSVKEQNPKKAALSVFEKNINKKTRIVVTTIVGD